MDKLREAMELALKENWQQLPEHAPVDPIATLRQKIATGRPPSARSEAATPVVPPPRRVHRVAPPAERSRAAPPSRAPSFALPEDVLRRNRLAAAIDDHPARETYCLLQAAVLERLAGNENAWIGVTGPRSGRGKTLTAANLAISLAADAGRNVLLIDLDLRNPGVHGAFGLDPGKALEDCLFGRATLDEALLDAPIPGLTLLPSRKPSRSADQVFVSSNFKVLLEGLRTRFAGHLAVVDLPALEGGPDAGALKALVDGLLIVVEDGVTREADYRRTLASVGKAKLIGTVLNRTEPSA